MSLFRSLVVFLFAVVVSGCGTLNGLKQDIQGAISPYQAHGMPKEVCERFYAPDDNSLLVYRKCLSDEMRKNLSHRERDALYFGKTFPKCRAVYRRRTATSLEYRACQEVEALRPEVNHAVSLRHDRDNRENRVASQRYRTNTAKARKAPR